MRPLLLLAVLALAGCKNNCQQLCTEMFRFADDCGLEWDKEDLSQCVEDFGAKNVGKSEREYCGTISDALSEEWECDDLQIYFDGGGSSGDESTDAGS